MTELFNEDSPLPFFLSPLVGGQRDENQPVVAPEKRQLQILLIEDNPGDRRLIEELLAGVEGVTFTLHHSRTLQEGLRQLRAAGVDAILLDLSLPDCRGLQSFLEVHAHAPTVPVVVMTGFNDEVLAVKAVQEGAEDYLVKGYVTTSLLARALRYAIERNRRRQAERRLRETAEQFRAARTIQQHLFPRSAPCLPGFDLAGASHPAEATGGDYFDYVPMLDGSTGIVVGDVSGHGFGSALLMASTRAYLRALAQTHIDIGTILTLANRVLCHDVADDRFVSILLARLDLTSRTLIYGSAGQPTGYLLDQDGKVRVTLPSMDMPLGVLPEAQFSTSAPLELHAGDTLLLLTDGVVEEPNAADIMFGSERALAVVRRYLHVSAQEIVARLHEAVCAHSSRGISTRELSLPPMPAAEAAGPRHDDFTAVVLKAL